MAKHAEDDNLPEGRPAADILAEHDWFPGSTSSHTDPHLRGLPTGIRRRIQADKNAAMKVPPKRVSPS